MSPAPPPPPPANILNNSSSSPTKASSTSKGIPNTSALLKSIEKGTKLKKTVTVDKSAPLISRQPNASASNKDTYSSNSKGQSEISQNTSNLGGLFANGFPTLKSTKKNVNEMAIRDIKAPDIYVPSNNTASIAALSTSKCQISKVNDTSLKLEKTNPAKVAATIQSKAQEAKSHIKNYSEDLSTSNIQKTMNGLTLQHPDQSDESERWIFPKNVESSLPAPRKFSEIKKTYLSQTSLSNLQKTKTSPGAQVSEEDIDGFIKSLKSKLNKAAAEENFEECVRLKSKMKSFDIVKKRIQSKEKVFASDLPK